MQRRDFIKGLFGAEIVAANTNGVCKTMTGLLHYKDNSAPKWVFDHADEPAIEVIGVGEIGGRALSALTAIHPTFKNDGKLLDNLSNTAMVFVIAGTDNEDNLGAVSLRAGIARKSDAIIVGVIVEPIDCEGKITEQEIIKLYENTDALIVIQKEYLVNLSRMKAGTPYAENLPERVLVHTVKSISDVIITSGFLNVDFADIQRIMSSSGRAIVGMGSAKGAHRARQAAHMAITNHLLADGTIKDARGVLINITGNDKMSITECNEACGIIKGAAGRDADIISGYIVNPVMQEELMVTVVATGVNVRG